MKSNQASRFLALCFLCGALAACQMAPVTAAPIGKQDATAAQLSPVSQEKSISLTINMIGSGTLSGQASSRVSSDGDVKSSERQQSTGATVGPQTSTPTQSNDLSGLADAAVAFLKTVDPTSAAGALATQAIASAKAGKLDVAKTQLEAAKKAVTTPGSAPVDPAPADVAK